MESQDHKPGDGSPQIELEPRWHRRMMQVICVTLFGAMSVGTLVNLIVLPHILTAVSVVCFVVAAVVSFRAMGRAPKPAGGMPPPGRPMRPLLVHVGQLALILVLFVGGILLLVLRRQFLP